MKEYNRLAACPKCGCGGPGSWDIIKSRYKEGWLGKGPGEIKRTCPRCGFVWYEKPLDAKDE